MASSSAFVHPGLTRNRAPASTVSRTCSGEITVPAPTTEVTKVAASAAGATFATGMPRPTRIGPRNEPPPIP